MLQLVLGSPPFLAIFTRLSTQLHYTTHLESRAERQFNRTEIRLYDVQYTPITFKTIFGKQKFQIGLFFG